MGLMEDPDLSADVCVWECGSVYVMGGINSPSTEYWLHKSIPCPEAQGVQDDANSYMP